MCSRRPAMRIQTILFAASLAAFAPACSSIDSDESDDAELAGDTDGKADGISSTSTFYSLRPDFRKCVSPLCGGSWVKRVNFSTTKCADGQYAAECYVAETDLTGLGLSDAELGGLNKYQAVLRGSIVKRTYGPFGKLGAFKASEAWAPANSTAPTGTFYKVTDLGIRCITFPCLSTHEAKLNSTTSANIAGF